MRRHFPRSSVVLGVVLTLGFSLAPAQAAPPVQPKTQAAVVPFSGSATFAYTAAPEIVPARASKDLLRGRQTETFAIRDATHWRIEVQVTAPVLDSSSETIVANGQRVAAYDTLFNHAYRLPGGVTQSAFLLSDLFREPGVPFGTTAAQYMALVERIPGEKVRLLGQTQVLGRTADILQTSPLGRTTSGPCNGAKNCAQTAKGYGSATIWLDHQYGIVLRYQQHGVPKTPGAERHLRYRVTAITFGRGPSNSDLAYKPPVPVQSLPANASTGSSGSFGSGGAGTRLQAPPGLIALGSPAGMTLRGAGSGDEWLSGGPSYAEGQFRGAVGGFVYVKERIRALGLPSALMAGSPQNAGSCPVWTGTFPDGLRWLTMERGKVAIMVVANTLTPAQLVQYAANGICPAPIVPLPTAQQTQDTALDHLETEIDITRQILGWAIAAAPSAVDKTTLQGFDRRLEAFDRLVFAIRYGTNTTYRHPSFPPPTKESYKEAVAGLTGEMGAAKAQLAAAEAAVQLPADRQTLVRGGTVFDDLIRAVDSMLTA